MEGFSEGYTATQASHTTACKARGSRHYAKLLLGVELLNSAPRSFLRDVQFVAQVIRTVGLSYDPRGIYGLDNAFMNSSRFGLWQHPLQLARALVEIAPKQPRSLVEIGTFKGFTATILAAYFRRFSSDVKVVTIDPVRHVEPYPIWQELGVSYHQGTSADFAGAVFDLCMIDGDHTYQGVARDYFHLGRHANICMFHDVAEAMCPEVGEFWRQLKRRYESQYTFSEYLDHSSQSPVMGIGVCERLTMN